MPEKDHEKREGKKQKSFLCVLLFPLFPLQSCTMARKRHRTPPLLPSSSSSPLGILPSFYRQKRTFCRGREVLFFSFPRLSLRSSLAFFSFPHNFLRPSLSSSPPPPFPFLSSPRSFSSSSATPLFSSSSSSGSPLSCSPTPGVSGVPDACHRLLPRRRFSTLERNRLYVRESVFFFIRKVEKNLFHLPPTQQGRGKEAVQEKEEDDKRKKSTDADGIRRRDFLSQEDLDFALNNLELFSPSHLLILLQALVHHLPSSSSSSSLSSSSSFCLLLEKVIDQLGVQLLLLPDFPTSVFRCGFLVLSSSSSFSPSSHRFWMSFYRLFLSASSHTQQGGSAGVHGGRRLLSSHEILRLLSFLACKKRKENFLRTDRNKTLSSFSSSSFSSSSSCSFSSSFIPLPSSSSSLQGFIESRVEPSSSKDFDPSISKEEKEKERKEEDGEREESSVAQEREGGEEGLVSNEKLFVTSHIKEGKRSSSSSMTSLSSSSSFSSQDGTSPPSPSSECSERVLRYERRERLTSSSLAQERNLEEKLLLALCRRMCIRGVFSSLRPSSLIDLLLLLSELRVKKFTPLFTEISRSLQPLCPSIDLSKLSTTPDLLSAAPSKHVGAGEGRAPRLFSLSQDKLVDVGREDIEETSQTNDEGAKKKKKTTKTKKKKKGKTGEEEHDPMSILHDLSSCGLNTVFTPNDLVCIYTSFASLGAREFQQFLRSLGDVLSLHIPHFPFTTDVSLLYSCSQLNFYPRNLINSLLYHLPKKLSSDLERYQGIDGESKSHPDQGKTEMTLERGGENQRASGVHTPLEAHRDNLERTCFKKDYFLEDHPSDNRNFILPSPSFSPSAPLYERSGGRMKVSFLLKALARLNSRHKPTLSITLEGLKHHHHVRVDPLRNKDPSSPKKANPPIYSCSSSSFSPSLSTCSSDSSSPVKSERSHTGPESLFFWRTGEVEDDAVSVLYSLYRLDVWHAETIHRSLEVLSRYDGAGLIDRLGLKGCLNTLLAVTYFSCTDESLYNLILPQILAMETKLSKEGLTQLKIIELASRVGHTSFSFDRLSPSSRDLLLRVRSYLKEPDDGTSVLSPHEEERGEEREFFEASELQKQVALVARSIGYHSYSEIQVGPYTLDFVKPLTPEEISRMCLEEELEKATGTKQLHTPHSIRDPFEHELHTKGIVLEVDGPQHFYRDSFHWTSSSKLKHRLLTRLGFRVVHVPYFDWLKLHTQNLRRAYLQCALEKCLREQNPLNDNLETRREGERNLDDLKRWVLFCEERKKIQRETQKTQLNRFDTDRGPSSSSSRQGLVDSSSLSRGPIKEGNIFSPTSSFELLNIKRETSSFNLSLDGEISEKKTSFLHKEKKEAGQTERERSRPLSSVSHEQPRHLHHLENERSRLRSPRLVSKQREERNERDKGRRDSGEEEGDREARGEEEEREERSSVEEGEEGDKVGMRERGFLTIFEQELLLKKKHADPTKARRIFLTIFKRERKRMKRRKEKERKSQRRNFSLGG